MKARLVRLRLMAAASVLLLFAIGAAMGNTVVNWGSSVQLTEMPGEASSSRQLVRVELPQARDVALYLGNPADSMIAGGTGAVRVAASIEYGAGGVSHSTEIDVPPQGVVWHVVAKSVTVRARRLQAATVQGPRFQAYAGLGCPSPFMLTHQTFAMPPAGAWSYALRPWVRAVRLRVLTAGVTASDISLEWMVGAVQGGSAGAVSSQFSMTADQMLDHPVAVVNSANAVRIRNNGLVAAVNVRLEQLGEM